MITESKDAACPMPTHRVEKLLPLDPNDPTRDRLRIEYLHEGRNVLTFVVQYEVRLSGKHYPVVRYDTAHGTPHCDILDGQGNKTKRSNWTISPTTKH